MFRLIGAVLLVLGTGICGLSSVLRLRQRARILSGLTLALEIMQSEICERMTPLPELVAQLAGDMEEPVRSFFRRLQSRMEQLGEVRFYEIWKKAVENSPELLLTVPEQRALCELGHSLGRYNLEQQRGAILYVHRKMETFARRAEEERIRNSRTNAFLGVAAGVFAVMILL